MRRTFGVGAFVVAFLGIAAIMSLGATLILGVTGSAGASTWTGTVGVVLLAVWLVVINGHRRSRIKRAPTAPLTEAARA